MESKTSLDYDLEISQYQILLAELQGYLSQCVVMNSPMPVKTAENYELKIKTLLSKYVGK